MYRIIDKKGTGKTSRLLLLAKENNGIVVCAYPDWMREKAYKYGITGIDFISYDDFIKNIAERNLKVPMYAPDGTVSEQEWQVIDNTFDKPIFIDEIETLVRRMCFSKFLGYTLSED